MRCEQTQLEIKAYADGELAGLQRWRVRRHLAHCPDCAAQFADMVRVHGLLLAADVAPRPIPAEPARSASHLIQRGSTRMALKLICGAVATAGLALAMLTLPSSHRTRSMAAEVRRAFADVNTWHLRGWTLFNGKQVHWEVWGRRTPFFYREQVGKDVIIDDGKQHIGLFAPMPRRGDPHSPGVMLKTPSLPDPWNSHWSYERMTAQWNDSRRAASETPTEATFNDWQRDGFSIGILGGSAHSESADVLTTVSKQTWLPTHYEVHFGALNNMQTTSLLDADYNSPLPAQITALPAAPSKYRVYDATQPPPHLDNAVTINGVTVQATPLALDVNGLILFRIRSWLGKELIGRDGPLSVNIAPDSFLKPGAVLPANTDDRERAYAWIRWDKVEFGANNSTDRLMLFAPADPLPADAPLPSQLTLRLNYSADVETRLNAATIVDQDQVLFQQMTLTVPLPAPSDSIEQTLPAYLDPDWKIHIPTMGYDGQENLPAAIDLSRAQFYSSVQDPEHPQPMHEQRAATYYDRYFAESSCPYKLNFERLSLADIKIWSHKPGARPLLQAVLDDKRLTDLLQSPPPLAPELAQHLAPSFRKWTQDNNHYQIESLRKQARKALDTLGKD